MITDKSALIIFGVSGDLSRRKLLPALFRLYLEGALPKKLRIYGVTRQKLAVSSLRDSLQPLAANVPFVALRETLIDQFLARLQIIQMDSARTDDYAALKAELESRRITTRLFYLSIPPLIALPVIEALADSGVSQKGDTNHRLLLEKPFGFDLYSAEEFVARVSKTFDESQLYRIDHYMAKETARNIAHMRFRNPLLTHIWTNDHIESIEIIANEKIGIEGRVQFYEQTGALRDVLQSHLLSLAALAVMNEPAGKLPEDIHAARLAALKSIDLRDPKVVRTAFRAQYATYRKETGNQKTRVETFACVDVVVTKGALKGVPIRLATGKNLSEKRTQIKVTFIDRDQPTNYIRFEIQPTESIHFGLNIKTPGLQKSNQATELSYTYAHHANATPDGYESVLLDALTGDRTNFVTSAELIETWRIVDPVIAAWSVSNRLATYASGATPEEVMGDS